MNIVVAVTGGIAAYKSVHLVRLLITAGHEVTVVPTEDALRFVGLPTWEAISRRPVTTSVHEDVAQVRHVALGQAAQRRQAPGGTAVGPVREDIVAARGDHAVAATKHRGHRPAMREHAAGAVGGVVMVDAASGVVGEPARGKADARIRAFGLGV